MGISKYKNERHAKIVILTGTRKRMAYHVFGLCNGKKSVYVAVWVVGSSKICFV